MRIKVEFQNMSDAQSFIDAADKQGFKPKSSDNGVVFVTANGRERGRELEELAERYNGDARYADKRILRRTQRNPIRRRGLKRFRRHNPLTGTEDLGLAFLGVAVVGVLGYAIVSKMTANTAAVGTNPNIQTLPNQTQQEAYDAWVMQQIQAGKVTPAQVQAGG